MSDPVGDAEGAEFGEVAVVEDQDEVTGLVAEALQHVAVAAREVPDVAGVEIVGLGEAAWVDDGGADAALKNERPFGRGGVPVQFAHRAGLKPHRDAGDPLGDRQLRNRRLLAVTVADDLAVRLLQREFEGRQILARERWVRNIVHETRIATGGRLGPTQRCQRGQCLRRPETPGVADRTWCSPCGPAKCSDDGAHAITEEAPTRPQSWRWRMGCKPTARPKPTGRQARSGQHPPGRPRLN